MKILWAKTDYLHPTNRGGQIRTLEMVKRLNRRHEVHYIAYDDPCSSEGRERASEYSLASFPVNMPISEKGSPRFFGQLAINLMSRLPFAVQRYHSETMQRSIAALIEKHNYDAVIADFLSITPNFHDLSRLVLFQHNVETSIWKRHAEHATSRVRRAYFRSQARRMERYERAVCRAVRQVISVSPTDTATMRNSFAVDHIDDVPTGVDVDFFRRPESVAPTTDLVFVGSMEWLPNVDGGRWFMEEVFPRILMARPGTTLTFAGRNPSSEIRGFADSSGLVRVTGTVPDVRPYIWGAGVSIVPLRIGGGTRLKIYESMAAGTPVVSTPVGAEGLAVTHGKDIVLAERAEDFAREIILLLEDPAEWKRISEQALTLVTDNFSWESVAQRFENILNSSRRR